MIYNESFTLHPLRINFLPYSFEQKIGYFSPHLSFIGTTYYDGYNVYEHLIKPETLLGFKVTKVELYFSNGNLIGASIFLDEKANYIEDVRNCIAAFMDIIPSEVQNDRLQSVGSMIYSWEDDTYSVGLLSNTSDEQIFIHAILREFQFLW